MGGQGGNVVDEASLEQRAILSFLGLHLLRIRRHQKSWFCFIHLNQQERCFAGVWNVLMNINYILLY